MSQFVIAMTRVPGDVAEVQAWAEEAGAANRLLVSLEIRGATTVVLLSGEDDSLGMAFQETLNQPGSDWAFQDGSVQFHRVS